MSIVDGPGAAECHDNVSFCQGTRHGSGIGDGALDGIIHLGRVVKSISSVVSVG